MYGPRKNVVKYVPTSLKYAFLSEVILIFLKGSYVELPQKIHFGNVIFDVYVIIQPLYHKKDVANVHKQNLVFFFLDWLPNQG